MPQFLSFTITQLISAFKKAGFATKDDLKPFATKDDAKSFATKADLKQLITKSDAKSFATKDDLKKLATKNDVLKNRQEIRKVAKALEEVEITIAKGSEDHELRIRRLESFHPPN